VLRYGEIPLVFGCPPDAPPGSPFCERLASRRVDHRMDDVRVSRIAGQRDARYRRRARAAIGAAADERSPGSPRMRASQRTRSVSPTDPRWTRSGSVAQSEPELCIPMHAADSPRRCSRAGFGDGGRLIPNTPDNGGVSEGSALVDWPETRFWSGFDLAALLNRTQERRL
jgi:hypothetical protein